MRISCRRRGPRWILRARGKLPIPPTPLRLIGNTQMGSLLLSLRDGLSELLLEGDGDQRLPLEEQRASDYLQTLQQAVSSQGSELLVIIIGERPDEPPQWKKRFEMAIGLMQALSIAYLDTSPFIQAPADYATPPDGHWSNAGHEKVGALLGDCLEIFFASGSLANCEHVVMPGSASE